MILLHIQYVVHPRFSTENALRTSLQIFIHFFDHSDFVTYST
mgnify:CR=1 FL=1